MCSVFGDLALLYDAPRSATVTATSSGKVWKMERHVYQAIKQAHSKDIEMKKSDAIQSIPLLKSLPLVCLYIVGLVVYCVIQACMV